MKRFLRFLRSALPADLRQLLLLGGVLCLFLSSGLRWFPSKSLQYLRASDPVASGTILVAWCSGFLMCFRRSRHPAWMLFGAVALPSALGIILNFLYYIQVLIASLNLAEHDLIASVSGLFRIVASLGPGFYYALLGFLLISCFTATLALGRTSLPLVLPESSVFEMDKPDSWRRVELFMWVFLAFNPPFRSAFLLLGIVRYMVYLVAVWIIRREVWSAIRRYVRVPKIDSFVLAAAFPVGIAVFISAGKFLFDLVSWVARQSHPIGPPHIERYFGLPTFGLLLVPFALVNEIIFRGALQPIFIRRYGIARGIFLLSIVYASAHVGADLTPGFSLTDEMVVFMLSARLAMSIGFCFIAGWLTLRTGSVLPAALFNCFYNMMGSSTMGRSGPVMELLQIALACVLFRYWPVAAETLHQSVVEV